MLNIRLLMLIVFSLFIDGHVKGMFSVCKGAQRASRISIRSFRIGPWIFGNLHDEGIIKRFCGYENLDKNMDKFRAALTSDENFVWNGNNKELFPAPKMYTLVNYLIENGHDDALLAVCHELIFRSLSPRWFDWPIVTTVTLYDVQQRKVTNIPVVERTLLIETCKNNMPKTLNFLLDKHFSEGYDCGIKDYTCITEKEDRRRHPTLGERDIQTCGSKALAIALEKNHFECAQLLQQRLMANQRESHAE